MTERVALIDGAINATNDYDLTQTLYQLIGRKGGVHRTSTAKNELALSGTTISPGTATVVCTRTGTAPIANQKFLAVYQTDANITGLAIGGNQKIFIEFDDTKVQSPALNTDVQGLNIGKIKSATAYPTTHTNYLKLYEYNSGVLTDLRNAVSIEALGVDLSTYIGAITGALLSITGNVTIGGLLTVPNATIGGFNVVNELTPSFPSFSGGLTVTIQKSARYIGTGGNTCTLYASTTANTGRDFILKNDGTGIITLVPATGNTIDGLNGIQLLINDAIWVRCTGIGTFKIISRYKASESIVKSLTWDTIGFTFGTGLNPGDGPQSTSSSKFVTSSSVATISAKATNTSDNTCIANIYLERSNDNNNRTQARSTSLAGNATRGPKNFVLQGGFYYRVRIGLFNDNNVYRTFSGTLAIEYTV